MDAKNDSRARLWAQRVEMDCGSYPEGSWLAAKYILEAAARIAALEAQLAEARAEAERLREVLAGYKGIFSGAASDAYKARQANAGRDIGAELENWRRKNGRG